MELGNKRRKRPQDVSSDNKHPSLTLLLEDLLFEEILPRLPAKSLARFKLVSKKWLHFIADDPRLASNQLRRQSERHTLFSSLLDGQRILILDHVRNKVSFTHLTFLMQRFAGKFQQYHVVGSCHGLVCIALRFGLPPVVKALPILQDKYEAVVLWNPQTGQGRNTSLPPLPRSSFYLRRAGEDYPVYGFGHDELHDDYKAVRVLPAQPTLLVFDVFSRNIGSWRRLEKGLSGYTVCTESRGCVLLHGRLYWLVLALESADSFRRRCILSLDLRTDEFRIIDVLDHSIAYRACPIPHRLIKWNGNCLAYLSFPDDRSEQDSGNDFGLQMILDGNGDFVAGQNAARGSFRNGQKWKFCGVSCDQFVVTEYDIMKPGSRVRKLVMCDPFSRDYENIGRREVLSFPSCTRIGEAHDYTPSLVSVYSNKKTEMEENKKMDLRYWVDMFWKKLVLT